MATLTINGAAVTVPDGTNLIEAGRRAGAYIPFYCWHEDLSIAANCRMCLVEVNGAPKLQPACQTPVKDGMTVRTDTAAVREAQRATMEFLLLNHPIDCPVCDQAGECKLQDYYMAYDGQAAQIPARDKRLKPRQVRLGPHVLYNAERCILCTRCVRFMNEIAHDPVLDVAYRGSKAEIIVAGKRTLTNPYSLNTVDLCPVGALTSVHFRFRQRVWNLRHGLGVCMGCARGCNVRVDHRAGSIYRLNPMYHPLINRGWMCDEGRLTHQRYNTARYERALVRGGETAEPRSLTTAYDAIAERLRPFLTDKRGAQIGLTVSAYCACEDAAAAAELAHLVGICRVAVTGLPDGTQDEFLRRADRNPNRAGVTAILQAKGLALEPPATLWNALRQKELTGLYQVGAEVEDEVAHARHLTTAEPLVYIAQAVRATEATAYAHVLLPAASPYETNATIVSHGNFVQRTHACIERRGEAYAHSAHLTHVLARLRGDRATTPDERTWWPAVAAALGGAVRELPYEGIGYPSRVRLESGDSHAA